MLITIKFQTNYINKKVRNTSNLKKSPFNLVYSPLFFLSVRWTSVYAKK